MLNELRLSERPATAVDRSTGSLRPREDVLDTEAAEATILRILGSEPRGLPRAHLRMVMLGAAVLLAATVFQFGGFEGGTAAESNLPDQGGLLSAPSLGARTEGAVGDLSATEEPRPISTEQLQLVLGGQERPLPAFSSEHLRLGEAQTHVAKGNNISEPSSGVLAAGPKELSGSDRSASALSGPRLEDAPAVIINGSPEVKVADSAAPVQTQALRASPLAEAAPSKASPPASAIITAARRRSGTIRGSDYPPNALRALAQGFVGVSYTVAVTGRVSDCTVISSSGRSDLDSTTCRLIQERFRFDPAKNAAGQAVPQTVTRSHEWYLRVRK
jgi:protein TonB